MAASMSAAPSVIRRELLEHETRYTHVPNAWARDELLSYKARGLLLLLLSHRDGFEVSVNELAAGSHKEGRDAVMSGLKELQVAGYLRLDKSRDAAGTFRTEYVLTTPPERLDLPVDNSQLTESPNPTRSRTRSSNPTATRSSNPTSIQNPIREIRDSQRNPKSAPPAPVDNPCEANSAPGVPREHRWARWGSCADCGELRTA